MRRAHALFVGPASGRQTKIRRRLGVSDTPGELNGPTTWTPSTSRGIAVAAAERVARQEADEFIRFDAGALDERHRHVVGAGLHLHRNVGEPLHDLGPPGRAAAIDGPHVLRAAQRLAEHFAAVDQEDRRVWRVSTTRV